MSEQNWVELVGCHQFDNVELNALFEIIIGSERRCCFGYDPTPRFTSWNPVKSDQVRRYRNPWDHRIINNIICLHQDNIYVHWQFQHCSSDEETHGEQVEVKVVVVR